MPKPTCPSWLDDSPSDVCGNPAVVLVLSQCDGTPMHTSAEAFCPGHLCDLINLKLDCTVCDNTLRLVGGEAVGFPAVAL